MKTAMNIEMEVSATGHGPSLWVVGIRIKYVWVKNPPCLWWKYVEIQHVLLEIHGTRWNKKGCPSLFLLVKHLHFVRWKKYGLNSIAFQAKIPIYLS
jgi:hypothetical protein